MMPDELTNAGIGAAIGAFLTKVIGIVLRRKFSEADSIRRELRERAERIEKEFKNLHVELDSWKDKYYSLMGQHAELKAEYKTIKAEIELLKAAAPQSNPVKA